MFGRTWNNIVTALRSLRSAKLTSAGAILTLAIAAGINLAVFDLIDRALLSPPSGLVDPARVFTLAFQHSGPDGQAFRMVTTSFVTFDAIRTGVPAATASAWRRISTGVIVDGTSIQIDATLVSGSYFAMLGAAPALGRTILPDDDRPPSGAPIAVLSHGFWAKTFASDRNVLGRRITLQGRSLVIAGVMPAGFSGHSASRADLWMPIHAAMDPASGWDRNQFTNVVEVGMRIATEQNQAAATTQASSSAGFPVVLTAVAGRWLQSMLFGTTALDPVVLGAAAMVMVTVALAATLVPARQASRTNPSVLLRTE